MPAGTAKPWIICYDIADPKRLARVHRVVSRHAVPLQYSVFHTVETRENLRHIVDEVAAHMDIRCDDLRAYPLAKHFQTVVYGKQVLPAGVSLPRDGIEIGPL